MQYIYGPFEPYHTDQIGLKNLFMTDNEDDVIKYMKDEVDNPKHKSSWVPFAYFNFLGTRGDFLRKAYSKIIPEVADLKSDFYTNPDKYGLYKGRILQCNISINSGKNGKKLEEIRPCIYLNNRFYYMIGFPPYIRPEV